MLSRSRRPSSKGLRGTEVIVLFAGSPASTKETDMALEKLTAHILVVFIASILSLADVVHAQERPDNSNCIPVGGALMTNIGAIAGVTNLGPASGDLSGSVA